MNGFYWFFEASCVSIFSIFEKKDVDETKKSICILCVVFFVCVCGIRVSIYTERRGNGEPLSSFYLFSSLSPFPPPNCC